MRYALRNKQKISDALSPDLLKRIIESLDSFFTDQPFISDDDCMLIEGDTFKTLTIEDKGHSFNLIAFFVINIKYDVYQLAFKEFIG